MSRHSSSLTSDDWARLGALIDSDADRSLLRVPLHIEGSKPLQQITREVGAGQYAADDYVQRYFTEWQRRNDPAYQASLERALDAVVAGGADDTQRALVAGEWDRLEHLVKDRTPGEQASIALVMMGLDRVAGSRSIRSTLEILRGNLAGMTGVPDELAGIRAQTIELVDRNVARLNGSTPAGAVRGYSNHPDYGEIGRIRANLTLLEHARVDRGPATVTGASEAAVSSTTPAGAAETLTW
jgi:hypothetical protein